MSIPRLPKLLLAIGLMVSIVTLFAPPGQSRENEPGGCPRFRPVEPESDSEQKGDVPKAKVLSVRDGMTRDDPLLIELDFAVALWGPPPSDPTGPSVPIVEDTKFFNVQVTTRRTMSVLNAKVVWDSPYQVDDLDAFLYNSQGKQVDVDDSPTGPQASTERVSFSARNCDGFTVETRAFRTLPRSATLQIWLRARG